MFPEFGSIDARLCSTSHQCTTTSEQQEQEDANRIIVPNIADENFNPANAAAFSAGPEANLTALSETVITQEYTFTAQPSQPRTQQQACEKSASSAEYCYTAKVDELGEAVTVFEISQTSSRGPAYSVQSTPRASLCKSGQNSSSTMLFCCDRTSLGNEAMRILILDEGRLCVQIRSSRLLGFADVEMERLEEESAELPQSQGNNSDITMSSMTMPLLRFYTGKKEHGTILYFQMCLLSDFVLCSLLKIILWRLSSD